MNVNAKASFKDDLQKIPAEEASKILKALKNMEDLKSLSESKHLKKMKGTQNTFRFKSGNYRILLHWNKEAQILNAESVAHRQSVYKKK
jgi:mRNA-degrading endonuclease RelE of RelBE toxin-antitoxin system